MYYNLFNQIINEANLGKIEIDGDFFPIAFNTMIYNNNSLEFSNYKENNFPTLIIKNKKLFFEKMNEYIKISLSKNPKFPMFINNVLDNQIKMLIAYLFANATTEDFNNPIDLLNRNIAFLNDNTFEYINNGLSVSLNDCFQASKLFISNQKQSVFMETPYKMDFTLINSDNEILKYDLPSISYGIVENLNQKECYIYSIINPKSNNSLGNQNKYFKSIKRELYKLNSGVMDHESVEYLNYINGNSNYYPENISDVSPSTIISLTAFISMLEAQNINTIKIVPYLPIRYLSRELSANDNENLKEQLITRNDVIQSNITDKFIRIFRRVAYHINGLDIQYYPYEFNEYMELKINEINHNIDNYILNEVYNQTYDTTNKFLNNGKTR